MAEPPVYSLVKGLSSSERRFLKLFSRLGTGRGAERYLQLLDLLDGMDGYDRDKLVAGFGGDPRDLAVNQTRLFDYILKSLRLQRSGASVHSQLRVLEEEVELLFERGLLAACRKKLRKAMRLAREYEQDTVLLKFYGWERKLEPNPPLEERQRIESEEAACLERVSAFYRLRRSHEEMRWLIRQENRARSADRQSEMEALLKRDALLAPPPDTPFLAYVYHQNTFGLFYTSTARWPEAIATYTPLMDRYLENPSLISLEPELFLGVQNNYMHACLFSVEHRFHFAELARQMREVPGLRASDRLKFQRITYQQQLLLEMNFGNLTEAAALVLEIAQWIESHRKKLAIRRILVFYYNFAILCFIRNDMSGCNRWTREIIATPGTSERADIRYFAHILAVIVQIELGQVDLQDSMYRAVRRKLKKSDRLQSFEEALIHFVRRVNQSLPGSLDPYKELLPKLVELVEHAAERPPLGARELILWINGKLEGNGTKAQYLSSRSG